MSHVVERFKIFFNKDNVEFSHGRVDPYEFHRTIFYLSIFFRVIDNERIPKWTILTPALVIWCGLNAALLSFLAMTQFIKIFNISGITEAGTYFIIMLYKVLIISCTITDLPHYHNFFRELRDDFKYICTKGSKYRDKYFENQLWTWKACIVSGLFIAVVAGGIIICASIALVYSLFHRVEGGARPLPFPIWLFDINIGKTPTYEILFMFSLLCVASQAYTYIFMMQTQLIWIRQIIVKADVIIWSLEDLLDDVHLTDDIQRKEYYDQIIKARMRKIIEMHHSMYRLLAAYSGVYQKLLMFEQKFCAPVVCLTAFCSAEKMDVGELPGILVLLCPAVIILVFIPSYMCTVLAEKIRSINDACWNIPFWIAPGRVIRPYLVLIMQRCLKPLPIQAPGFEEVSLKTFSSKMSFAYTCFNMLRQLD